ncbi:MAG TPA: flavin reductase family protein [Micromonosporaceae bacterium]|nr:flavin reductase family protein [Micromonosporaceae bacterium]
MDVRLVDTGALRDSRALCATCVTVLGVRDGDRPHAMTAGSFTWVSIEPPLVSVCVRRGALTGELIRCAGAFAVSVLAAGQEPLAWHFADPRRPAGAAQFAAVDWEPAPVTGSPLLSGCLARLDCALDAVTAAGDHHVLFGRVVWTGDADGVATPLLRFGRAYRRLGPEPAGTDRL